MTTPWSSTPSTYQVGAEAIEDLDELATTMERRWGIDRLPLLLPEDLRRRFRHQQQLTDAAILDGELATLQHECRRMMNAWRAADRAAEASDAAKLPPTVWEITMPGGPGEQRVAAIVKESEQTGLVAQQYAANGQNRHVYSLAEVGRILARFPTLYPSAAGNLPLEVETMA